MADKELIPPEKWRKRGRPAGKLNKVKTHVSIDPHIYLIARNTGNVSGFLNEAARTFIGSSAFKRYIKEWKESKGID